jgi:hypothetical protein
VKLLTRLIQAAAGAGGAIISSDSFGGGDLADITGHTSDAALGGAGATWATSTTTIGITSGQLYRASGTGLASARLGGSVANVSVSAKIAVLGSTTNYLLARFQDNSNHYRLAFAANGNCFVQKFVASSATTVISTQTYVAGDRLELRCVGTRIQLIKNGVLLAEATDTAFSAGTCGVAFQADTTARVDDIIVRQGVVLPFP